MSGHTILVIADIFGVLDHEAGVVGHLEPLHPSYQLRPDIQQWKLKAVVGWGEILTYDFPENMGPRISCNGGTNEHSN